MKSPREKAIERLRQVEKQRDDWVAKRANAEADIEKLRATVGDTALDDPEAADRLPRELGALLDQVSVAASALAAIEDRLLNARRDVILAEADEWTPVVAQRRAALDRHDKRVRSLLAQLEGLEGRHVLWQPARDEVSAAGGRLSLGPAPKSAILHRELREAETTEAILRAVAAGDDPRVTVPKVQPSQYPASVWGSDAVLPAPGWMQRESARAAAVAKAREDVALYGRLLSQIPGSSGPTVLDDPAYADRYRVSGLLSAAQAVLREAGELDEQPESLTA